jgi:hypothetical protein
MQNILSSKQSSPGMAVHGALLLCVLLSSPAAVAQDSTHIHRAVQVKTGRDSLFLDAMAARHWIDMNGNDVMTDSFNSSDPNHSNNGRYPAGDPTKILDNGSIASNDTIKNVINVGNANIYGHVQVGPGATIYVGPNGGVGTRTWQSSNPGGTEPGYLSDDMNFTFPSVSLPYTSGLSPSSGTITTTASSVVSGSNVLTSATLPWPLPAGGVTTNVSYTTVATPPSPAPYGMTMNPLTTSSSSATYPAAGTYVGTVTVQGNKYYFNTITGYNYTYPTYTYTYAVGTLTTNSTVTSTTYDYILQGGAPNMPPVDYYVSDMPKANVYVTGNVRLVVAGNVAQSGQDAIVLAPDGKLQMWVGGTSVNLTGQGVMNPTGYAQNCVLWCADSVTSVKLVGNGVFTGILVAPNADVTLNGSGSSVQDFVGSLLANTVKLNGHFNFHYDEALKNYLSSSRFKVTLWNEIPVPVASN